MQYYMCDIRFGLCIVVVFFTIKMNGSVVYGRLATQNMVQPVHYSLSTYTAKHMKTMYYSLNKIHLQFIACQMYRNDTAICHYSLRFIVIIHHR